MTVIVTVHVAVMDIFFQTHTTMTQSMSPAWQPDASQLRVIETPLGGYHLVLAPPGCGKTQILTERIRRANDQGIAYGDMLCLTFTNRAARGMRERIAQYIEGADLSQLYVGNIHRFCSRFLFEHHLVEAETSVIDDDDALSILARYQNEEESAIKQRHNRRREYAEIIQFAHFMHQIIHHHPRGLRLHPDCVSADDVRALKAICRAERREFTPDAMIHIYDHTDDYRDVIHGDAFDVGTQALAANTLRKMRYAHAYTAYCRQNKLIDFEDLLLLTYDALTVDNDYPHYRWIQVDEVQDLNAMQMAIIDLITDTAVTRGEGMVMYLGDAQQAIFSFMGAKSDTLALLRQRCGDHIYHLNINHRSPASLLAMTNHYAAEVLGVDRALLPTAQPSDAADCAEMRLIESPLIDSEYHDVAALARSLALADNRETTAIVVNSNYDADKVGEALHALDMSFFQVSGTDIFASVQVKTMLAHLNVLASETNFMAWARLLYGLGVFAAPASAREFMRKMLNRALLPSDFLLYDSTTYVQDFVAAVDADAPVVVFDTETTGLSVFDDDILQIAAVKMQHGRMVEGSSFVVHIQTERPIPEMLGDIPNPIIEERRHATLVGHAEALRQFVDYIGDCRLVGHNVEYDYQILVHNLSRYLPEAPLPAHDRCIDTLKLLRLLHPELVSYRLDFFRRQHLFGLSEDNAHLADVDVEDTCRVMAHLYRRCREVIPEQQEFLDRAATRRAADMLRRNYRDLYVRAREQLYDHAPAGDSPAMVGQMRAVYDYLRQMGGDHAQPHKIDYVLSYIAHDIVDSSLAPSLAEQLQRHLMETNTLKESDLCGSDVLDERIFVSTIHKAKGLEFDNVIVFDVVDGRYPNYFTRDHEAQCAEDRRKLYVALTRARRRVYVAWSSGRIAYRGDRVVQYLSPFLLPVVRYFDSLS